jgi:hypothetical protein
MSTVVMPTTIRLTNDSYGRIDSALIKSASSLFKFELFVGNWTRVYDVMQSNSLLTRDGHGKPLNRVSDHTYHEVALLL